VRCSGGVGVEVAGSMGGAGGVKGRGRGKVKVGVRGNKGK